MSTPTMPLLHWGLCPDASDALRHLGIEADRIVQTIGNAPASAGVHAQDGTIDGQPYCAAVDLSVRHPTPWTKADVDSFLGKAAMHGFAGYHRVPGQDHWPCQDEEHVHMTFAGVAMKRSLRDQVHSWCHDDNGLISNAFYQEWQPSADEVNVVRAAFLAHNPADG